ncbi:hypothetical protein [Streptomyces sp. NPDC014623]|uniref:hypothetical protein n=1 Tax=Streptomyces sp. NPDC014623 TaxID=3364875 RepID=UPI0036FC48EB
MTTTAPDATTAPAPASASPDPAAPPAPVPVPPAFASRRSVWDLAVAVAVLAIAGVFYVLLDRPGLREPLDALGSVVGGVFTAVAFLWGASHMRRS